MTPDAGRLLHGLDLSRQRRLIVAVSGGSDSLSLLFLVHRFLQAHAPATPMLAVTVDHGLRPEAAAEAAEVGRLCREHGIAHRTVAWREAKPETGVSDAARAARYRLLADAADAFGADCILTGHTMDDQAETVAMRAQRGAGPGLAGMAAATLFDGRVWIVRPLLDTRRQALRDHLSALGVGWADDPSNEDPAYERVRMRSALAESGSVEALAAAARAAARARRLVSAAAARLVARHVSMPSPGLFRLDRAIAGEDREAGVLTLRALLAMAGGASRLPDLARGEAVFERLCSGAAMRVPLSRAVADARRGAVWIRREARDLPCADAGQPMLWDGRWRIEAQASPEGLCVAPLGPERAAQWTGEAGDAPKSLVRAALSGEPALFSHAEFIGLAAEGAGAVRVVSPFARFLPDFDLALADALARMGNARRPPPSPWKDHIGTQA